MFKVKFPKVAQPAPESQAQVGPECLVNFNRILHYGLFIFLVLIFKLFYTSGRQLGRNKVDGEKQVFLRTKHSVHIRYIASQNSSMIAG